MYPNLRMVNEGGVIKTELLIGCGNKREKLFWIPAEGKEWKNLTTLDFDKDCNPDVVHDLEDLPYPFDDNSFDEIHAYEVLEHTGNQGDWKFFFDQFSELHRILKPDGIICATVPMWNSVWAFGDPSHKRIISRASITFLYQEEYKKQIGNTSMTDFRSYWKKDFVPIHMEEREHQFMFILQAKK